MEENQNQERRPDIHSEVVRAGKRTYFFDVKTTRNGQPYLTITESKRRFLNDEGKFVYEKHKIFLYREDFEKCVKGLDGAIRYIELDHEFEDIDKSSVSNETDESHLNIEFEDLEDEKSLDKE